MLKRSKLIIPLIPFLLFLSSITQASDTVLSSWNNVKSKQAIMTFVEKITNKNNATYIKPSERIAVFDNDGTLWTEQSIYFQLAFAIDRVKILAAQHPE
jgi:hypothetical protein